MAGVPDLDRRREIGGSSAKTPGKRTACSNEVKVAFFLGVVLGPQNGVSRDATYWSATWHSEVRPPLSGGL